MNLTLTQTEVLKAIQELSAKELLTEAVIAKKIRSNTKLNEKNKAGIALTDIEAALASLEESNIFYSIHLNSANDLFIKKEAAAKDMDSDARHRRVQSEKSMSILTNGDFAKKNNGKGKIQKRNERKSLNIYSNFDDE